MKNRNSNEFDQIRLSLPGRRGCLIETLWFWYENYINNEIITVISAFCALFMKQVITKTDDPIMRWEVFWCKFELLIFDLLFERFFAFSFVRPFVRTFFVSSFVRPLLIVKRYYSANRKWVIRGSKKFELLLNCYELTGCRINTTKLWTIVEILACVEWWRQMILWRKFTRLITNEKSVTRGS